MDNLPDQFRARIAQYLSRADLSVMRTMNKDWKAASDDKLRRDKPDYTFIFERLEQLTGFNQTFANSERRESLSSSKFIFKLPLLADADGISAVNSFGETFGHLVSKLTLNFGKPARYKTCLETFDFLDIKLSEPKQGPWFTTDERNTVRTTVTSIIARAKETVEELNFEDYAGLDVSVIGGAPFPKLTSFKVNYIWGLPSDEPANFPYTEDCIVDLCRKIPNVQNFSHRGYYVTAIQSPSYLPNLLRRLTRVNPELQCQLGLILRAKTYKPSDVLLENEFFEALTQVPLRLTELSLLDYRENQHRGVLAWIGRQAPYLRKLAWFDFQDHRPGDNSKLLHLPVCEELSYVQWASSSLLTGVTSDRFPSLRAVTTSFAGDDFTSPLPNVTTLNFKLLMSTGMSGKSGEDLELCFLNAFPNVTTLIVDDWNLRSPWIYKMASVTKIITRYSSVVNDLLDSSFWRILNENVPPMTLSQIQDLPAWDEPEVTQDRHGNEVLSFNHLPNLREVCVGISELSKVGDHLNTLLYFSKLGKLPRLRKLTIEPRVTGMEVGPIYMEELGNYHDLVQVVPPGL